MGINNEIGMEIETGPPTHTKQPYSREKMQNRRRYSTWFQTLSLQFLTLALACNLLTGLYGDENTPVDIGDAPLEMTNLTSLLRRMLVSRPHRAISPQSR